MFHPSFVRPLSLTIFSGLSKQVVLYLSHNSGYELCGAMKSTSVFSLRNLTSFKYIWVNSFWKQLMQYPLSIFEERLWHRKDVMLNVLFSTLTFLKRLVPKVSILQVGFSKICIVIFSVIFQLSWNVRAWFIYLSILFSQYVVSLDRDRFKPSLTPWDQVKTQTRKNLPGITLILNLQWMTLGAAKWWKYPSNSFVLWGFPQYFSNRQM